MDVIYIYYIFPEMPCALVVPCQKGGYLVSVGKSICHFEWNTKQVRTICTVDEEKPTQINDGKCDAAGRLWFGKNVYYLFFLNIHQCRLQFLITFLKIRLRSLWVSHCKGF